MKNIFSAKAVVYLGYFVENNPMGSVSNLTDLLNCYDVDNNALITNSSVVGFGSSESEWILGIGNFFWFFGFVVIDQSNWQVGRKRSEEKKQNNKKITAPSPHPVHSGFKAGSWSSSSLVSPGWP